MTVTTGPKISSWLVRHPIVNPVMTVGSRKNPALQRFGSDAGLPPPVTTVPPSLRASAMYDSIFSRCPAETTAPMPVAGSEHWLPVLAGNGRVSFSEALAVIRELNYSGYVSFEWEKYWRPEIEAPEVALPDFINAIRNLVEDGSDTPQCSGVGK